MIESSVEKSANYVKRRDKAIEKENKTMEEFCDNQLLLLGREFRNNQRLVEKAIIENGYNIYCVDMARRPALIQCVPSEYKATYRPNGKLKLPLYLI